MYWYRKESGGALGDWKNVQYTKRSSLAYKSVWPKFSATLSRKRNKNDNVDHCYVFNTNHSRWSTHVCDYTTKDMDFLFSFLTPPSISLCTPIHSQAWVTNWPLMATKFLFSDCPSTLEMHSTIYLSSPRKCLIGTSNQTSPQVTICDPSNVLLLQNCLPQ